MIFVRQGEDRREYFVYFQGLKQRNAMRARFSRRRTPAYCVLLNRNATAFLNRKALSANALRREKSSTLNAGILAFIKAEDAGGLSPVKDDNAEKGQKNNFKAGVHSVPLLKTQHGGNHTASNHMFLLKISIIVKSRIMYRRLRW